ncbi:MAG: LuxR C-terminal-related transcriptional regulator, partial [Coriobacteriales bacterium]|nr:LuxR C-terminal-related transcriptional regulator [Coriobacteriales bacterium]
MGCSVGNLTAIWPSLFGSSGTLLIDMPVVNAILLIVVLAVMALGLFAFDEHQISTIWRLRTTDIATSTNVRCQAFSEHFGLTQRQAEVLLLICDGKRTKQIEKELVIANGTARAHIRGIYDKCG